MSAIRPDLPATLPAVPTGQAVQMRAAQAAFFRAAMGDVQQAPAQANAGLRASAVEPDALRLPRPGQLLDIRV